jgi:HipA-like protein
MRRANVFCRGRLAGLLEKTPEGYRFQYVPEYLQNPKCPAISLSFPKRETAFQSDVLFPFFFGLLAEGDNKALQCRILRIDENDHFTRLLKTCANETIGGVTVEEVSS